MTEVDETATRVSWAPDYFGFEGRLGLRTFWTHLLIAFLCAVSIFLLPALLPRPVSNAAWLLTIGTTGWCQASLTWRRLNDHDYSAPTKALLTIVPAAGLTFVAMLFDIAAGWVQSLEQPALMIGITLLALISPLWLWATITLYIRPGTPGTNRFGPDPRAA